MGIENGSGIPVFNGEALSRSFGLADKFKNSGVLGEKSDPNERDVADEKAREILNTSFEVKNAEGQIHNIEYSSVEHMIEVSQDTSKTDDAREKTKQALYEVGLALSQDKAIFKAATEGEEELNKLLPPNLHEIQPYILSSYLTEGKDDTEGHELLGEMMGLFKLKRRADKNPEYYRDDFEEKAKSLFTKLFDKCDDASDEDVDKGRVGRWEAMMGFVKGIDDRTRRRPVLTVDREDSDSSADYEPPVYNPETREWEGGSKWELSPEYTAEAMKYMDYSMRWQSYTPPEWFKELPETLQARIEYMVMVNSAAAGLLHAGKDLEKILGNDGAFVFTNEQMTRLFDDDFKLVTSKMLNDLCEFYVDKNGIKSLRYKEKFYKLDKNSEDGFAHEADGRRIELPYTVENRGIGIRTIDQDVLRHIETIMDYKDEVALWLAEYKQSVADEKGVPVEKGVWATYTKDKGGHKKGEFILDADGHKIPGYLCKMDANTAYNLMFAMGDTSVWDRMRILPTYNGVIADAVRTLNPEYKALGKWMVIKSGRIKSEESLFDSEYFSGNLADYYLEVDKLERDLGGPIDGEKTIRQKVVDGELSLLSSKTFYGFFDFVNTGRDLYDANGDNNLWNRNTKAGVQKSLGELVMEYAFDSSGKVLPKDGRRDFSFGHKSVSFMNEFRDSMEGAILAYSCAAGKVKVEDPAVWARNLKDKMGMVNGIEFFNKKVFSYNRNPSFWRDAMIGSFGYDNRRLSSDHPYLLRKPGKDGTYVPYSKHVYRLLVDDFKLSNTDVDINQLMRLLGVDVKEGEYPNSPFVTLRNNDLERREIDKTENLRIKQRRKSKFDSHIAKDFDLPGLIKEIRELRTYSGYEEFDRMKRDFENLVKAGKGFEDK